MKAWNEIEEVGKKIQLFTKVIQGEKETLIDFLQRLTPVVNRMMQNSETRHIVIEPLDFEIDNFQCKRTIRPLNAKLVSLEEQIQDKTILNLTTMMILR